MSDGGKGSAPRPYSVSLNEFDNRWDVIFGKKTKSDPTESAESHDTVQSDPGTPAGQESLPSDVKR